MKPEQAINPIEQSFTKSIWIAVSLLMFSIGGFAFVMSFRQLLTAAYAGGKDRLWEYWTFPLLLDGGILLFTLAALWFTLLGLRWRYVARLFVFVFTFLTGVLNYNHAALHSSSPPFIGLDWLNEAQFIAICAPMVYFLCVEFYVLMLHKKMSINAVFVTLNAMKQRVNEMKVALNTQETNKTQLETEIATLEMTRETISKELDQMREHYKRSLVMLGMSNAGWSQRQIGEYYGVSAPTVNKALQSINGEQEQFVRDEQ